MNEKLKFIKEVYYDLKIIISNSVNLRISIILTIIQIVGHYNNRIYGSIFSNIISSLLLIPFIVVIFRFISLFFSNIIDGITYKQIERNNDNYEILHNVYQKLDKELKETKKVVTDKLTHYTYFVISIINIFFLDYI
jgi:hypothetical protein